MIIFFFFLNSLNMKFSLTFSFLYFISSNCEDSYGLSSVQTLYSLNNNIFLNNCFFSRISRFNGNGGIVSVSNINFKMSIIESVFYLCNSTQRGGSIYYYCETTYSESILKKNMCLWL